MEVIRELPAIARDLSPGLIAIGLFSLIAVIVGCIYQEWNVIPWMLITTMTLCGLGILSHIFPKTEKKPRTATSVAATAVIWLIVGICGSFPFLYTNVSLLDALFESMSAWTGTGFSIVSDIESWPKTLLFWRSFMQWIGGLGIIAFALTIGARSGLLKRGLYRSEGRSEAFMPSVLATAAQMWKIYVVLTGIAIIAILFTGVDIWDSVNIALCTISTGGLSIYNAGLAHFDNFALEMVLIPIMFAGAIPFRLYYLTFNRKSIKEVLHDRILHLILILFVVVAGIVILDLMITGGITIGEACRQGLFMASSALSSTGLQNTDFSIGWGIAPLLFIAIFMMIGGAQGSTAGGFKIDRIVVIIESIVYWFKKAVMSPKAIVHMRHNRKAVNDADAGKLMLSSLVLIVTYMMFVGIIAFIFLHDPYFAVNPTGTLFDIISCVGNNGISIGNLIGPMMPSYAKVLLILVMWIARLEIIPGLILIWGLFRGFNWESLTTKN
ncbi:MAG TPA: TrkH family potassium uptake protein [Methanocorpusculum sp.]|nr:TrkH family potassium uptake protein [Methanocorpusculum sp.]HJJ40063.1 TrkH family potassium uptake protein [Methanocorpusculum sp.]HJJ49546.1 TrkH family potassium uptake protein [Methanocorpusculum sp.]HJJ57098.1 TrkH family potassium uptake protein [Methanocorpusculum sp.]HJJ94986.1 TrkH family potassium uptake protein [Methanocorpusculum sp.]